MMTDADILRAWTRIALKTHALKDEETLLQFARELMQGERDRCTRVLEGRSREHRNLYEGRYKAYGDFASDDQIAAANGWHYCAGVLQECADAIKGMK